MTEEKEYIYKFITTLPQEHLEAVLDRLVSTSKGKIKTYDPIFESSLKVLTEKEKTCANCAYFLKDEHNECYCTRPSKKEPTRPKNYCGLHETLIEKACRDRSGDDYDTGYNTGYHIGYKSGYDAGYDAGVDAGYTEGYEDV